MPYNKEDVAWLAGFWEGEGSIKGSKTGSFVLNITQVDKEPLDKCVSILGFGVVYGPLTYAYKPNSQPYYTFSVSTFERVQQVVILIWPYLSRRRKDQIKACFARIHEVYTQHRGNTKFCRKRLHWWSEDNTYYNRSKPGKRQCRECCLIAQKARRLRLRVKNLKEGQKRWLDENAV